jgi:GTP cyclohydrolase II
MEELKSMINKLEELKVLKADNKEILFKAPKELKENILLTYSIKTNDRKGSQPLQVLLHIRTEKGDFLSSFGCTDQAQNKFIVDFFSMQTNLFMVKQYNKADRLKKEFSIWMK